MECFTTAESTTTNLWVCHRDCTDPWYITGVMVYYSAFTCLDTPFGPVLQWYLTIFGPIWKIISPLNSANFSTSDRMNEINFQNPIFGGFRVYPFGVVDICWVKIPKGTPSDYTLSIGTTNLHENFSSKLCTGLPKFRRFFCSGSAHAGNFW